MGSFGSSKIRMAEKLLTFVGVVEEENITMTQHVVVTMTQLMEEIREIRDINIVNN